MHFQSLLKRCFRQSDDLQIFFLHKERIRGILGLRVESTDRKSTTRSLVLCMITYASSLEYLLATSPVMACCPASFCPFHQLHFAQVVAFSLVPF